jgi:hypothetical protein
MKTDKDRLVIEMMTLNLFIDRLGDLSTKKLADAADNTSMSITLKKHFRNCVQNVTQDLILNEDTHSVLNRVPQLYNSVLESVKTNKSVKSGFDPRCMMDESMLRETFTQMCTTTLFSLSLLIALVENDIDISSINSANSLKDIKNKEIWNLASGTATLDGFKEGVWNPIMNGLLPDAIEYSVGVANNSCDEMRVRIQSVCDTLNTTASILSVCVDELYTPLMPHLIKSDDDLLDFTFE